MTLHTKKGYYTLEAAIFLPVFIIGILTLGYFIKAVSTAENVCYSVFDETSHLAAQAYGVKAAPLFPSKVEKRLKQENGQADKITINHFQYLYKDGQRTGLISLSSKFHINIDLPLDLHDGIEMESRLKCRGFIGSNYDKQPMSFDEMERRGGSQIVMVFPMWGDKYHSETCGYVKADAMQKVLTRQLKKQYNPCELCKPESLLLGTHVYCFANTGKAYHKGSCKMIDKYTIEIEKEDALAKGYTPCSKCKGG